MNNIESLEIDTHAKEINTHIQEIENQVFSAFHIPSTKENRGLIMPKLTGYNALMHFANYVATREPLPTHISVAGANKILNEEIQSLSCLLTPLQLKHIDSVMTYPIHHATRNIGFPDILKDLNDLDEELLYTCIKNPLNLPYNLIKKWGVNGCRIFLNLKNEPDFNDKENFLNKFKQVYSLQEYQVIFNPSPLSPFDIYVDFERYDEILLTHAEVLEETLGYIHANDFDHITIRDKSGDSVVIIDTLPSVEFTTLKPEIHVKLTKGD